MGPSPDSLLLTTLCLTARSLSIRQDGGDADCNTDSPVKVGVELPHQLAGRIAEEKFLADMLAINGVNRCGLFAGESTPFCI